MAKKFLFFFRRKMYGETIKRFEDKLLLTSIFVIALLHGVSVVLNILMGLNTEIILTSVLGTIIFSLLFLVIRFVSRNIFVYIVTSTITLLFLDVVWFVNYGSNGPAMSFFLAFYAFLILLFDRKYYWTITAVLLINLSALFIIELKFPGIIGSYPSRFDSLNDNYSGIVLSIVVIFLFIASIKNNYIQEFNRAKMADQLKSSFLANMSHEIRTPLNAIVGFSSLISDPETGEEEKKIFEKQVQQNSEYLLNLIADIIDVSKIESNQLNIIKKEFDVVPLINDVIQAFQLQSLSEKNISIFSDISFTEITISSDSLRFEQILRNLISNAVKFTQNGEIWVSYIPGKYFHTFSVKDTGIGIHSEHLQIIFDRFMKIENDRQHLFRGTGIGLFLTKQLLELLGGKIWVESEVGKGSVFYFTIPV